LVVARPGGGRAYIAGSVDYAAEALEALEAQNIKTVLLDGAEMLSRRIVAAHEMSIPWWLLSVDVKRNKRP
jgi:hypothetical protein